MTAPLRADPSTMHHTLTLFHAPDSVRELRILHTGRTGTVSGYFTDIEAMTKAAIQWSGKAPAVYATLNPCLPALLARSVNRLTPRAQQTTSDADIVQRRWFPIDFDPVRPAGISSTDAEHEAALQRAQAYRDWLQGQGWPAPVYADSGNGAHLLYRIDLRNDGVSRELVKRGLEAVALYQSDDVVGVDLTTFNAARVWKVYGTLACKGDHLPDRPHRLARLLDVPASLEVVPRVQLEALAALVPEPLQGAHRSGHSGPTSFDLENWIADHGLPVVSRGTWGKGGSRWILNPCPWDSAHTNRSAFVVQLANGAIAAGCHHNGCSGNDWHALRAIYEPGWQTRSATATPSPPPPSQWGNVSLVLTSLSDLLNEPEEAVEWLVEGLLPESGFSILVAKLKVGKSTLARNLALCVAQGKDFLGRKTQQGPVVYLALEEKRSEVRKHFLDMGATGEEEIFIYAASAPVDGLQQVRAAAERLNPVLIIIDPLFRLTRVKDGNDYALMTQALEPLLVLARETRAHVLCAHHAGKGHREGGDSVLGSTAIFGAVDTALFMRKMEGYRTLQSEQRYGTDLEETVLRYDQTTRTVTLGDTKEAEDEARLSQAIGEYLEGQSAPVTEAVIDDAVEGRRGLRKKALRQLVATGKVTRYGKGGKAEPFTYTLADTPPQQDSGFCGSLVPGIGVGTTIPQSKNGVISSNDAADCGSRDFAKIAKSREPENSLGNHNPASETDDFGPGGDLRGAREHHGVYGI